MSKQLDSIPLEAVLFDKEIVYHITRDEIFEAVFHKDRGILKEKKKPYREFTSATAFVNGHSTTLNNGRRACRVSRNGTEYRLQELFDEIKLGSIPEAKVMAPSTSKEEESMPPPTPQKMKGLVAVKHPECIVAHRKESDEPPIEITSITILKVVEYEWHGTTYWFDTTNKNLYTQHSSGGIGDLVGQLNERNQLILATP